MILVNGWVKDCLRKVMNQSVVPGGAAKSEQYLHNLHKERKNKTPQAPGQEDTRPKSTKWIRNIKYEIKVI